MATKKRQYYIWQYQLDDLYEKDGKLMEGIEPSKHIHDGTGYQDRNLSLPISFV